MKFNIFAHAITTARARFIKCRDLLHSWYLDNMQWCYEVELKPGVSPLGVVYYGTVQPRLLGDPSPVALF